MIKKLAVFALASVLTLLTASLGLAESNSEQEQRITLTLEESVERAFKNSFQIRRAVTGSEKAYIVRQKAVEDRDDQDPIIPTLDYLLALNVAQKNIQWMMSLREIELLKDRLEYDTIRLYYDIFNETAALEHSEMAFRHAEKKADRAFIMHNIGVLSRLDLERARWELQRASAEIGSREQELEGAYERFIRLVGLPIQEKPLLVDEPEWSPLRDLGVNLYVARAMDNNTALWLAEQQIELARYDIDLHRHYDLGEAAADPLAGPEPLEAKGKNISMAEDEYRDTKRQIEQNTRDIYRSMRIMEQEMDKLSSRIEELEREWSAQQTRLAAGLVTPYDFLELQAGIKQLKLQQNKLLLEHELLKFVIRKPWVLGGVAR